MPVHPKETRDCAFGRPYSTQERCRRDDGTVLRDPGSLAAGSGDCVYDLEIAARYAIPICQSRGDLLAVFLTVFVVSLGKFGDQVLALRIIDRAFWVCTTERYPERKNEIEVLVPFLAGFEPSSCVETTLECDISRDAILNG